MQTLRTIAAVACLLVLLPPALMASTFESKKDLHISNLHQIDDDLYVFGEKLQMDGSIAGDLLVFCYDARMAGTVGGSANFFCRSVRQSGTVLSSLRTFSEQATIEGNISGSYLGIGSRIDVGKGAIIERDLTVYGAEVNIEGLVRGNARIKGGRVTIAGTVEGDLFIKANKIAIIPPAIIRGTLTYESEKQEALDTTSGVIIAGGVTWQLPKAEEKKDEPPKYMRGFALRAASLFAAFIFGIIIVIFFRPYAVASIDQLTRRTSIAFATGLLSVGVLMVAIIVLVIALLTAIAGVIMVGGTAQIVGSIILIFASLLIPISGFVTLLGVLAFYTAKIVVAFVVGALIMRQAQRTNGQLSKTSLFIGLVLLTAVSTIPYVGWLFWLAIALFGAGALVLGVRSCRAQIPGQIDNTAIETMPPPAS